MWSASFRALGVSFSLEVAPELAGLTERLYRSYERWQPERPDVTYRLETQPACVMYRQGKRYYEAREPIDLVPKLELDLFAQLLVRSQSRWLLHAASVVLNGNAIVLSGRSGAGKSTAAMLSIERLEAGYISDEHTWITDTGAVSGVPRPIACHGPLAAASSLERSVYPVRTRDGALIEHELFHPSASALVHQPMPLAALAIIEYTPAGPPSLRELPASDALARLWSQSMTTGADVLQCAASTLARVPVFEIVSSCADDLCAALVELAG